MKAWHFSETAYPYLPPVDTYSSIRVNLPNRIYDPRKARRSMTATSTSGRSPRRKASRSCSTSIIRRRPASIPAAPLVLAALARVTKKARLLILGNPIANRRQPVRVAEEMAMVDILSHGRLEAGFVRGVPYEVAAGQQQSGAHERAPLGSARPHHQGLDQP